MDIARDEEGVLHHARSLSEFTASVPPNGRWDAFACDGESRPSLITHPAPQYGHSEFEHVDWG
jgi:hypothetical protein